MPQAEVYENQPTGTVTSGGTTTSDTSFTVTATNAFPIASTTPNPNTVFRIIDPANTAEIMLVTVAPGGTGAGQSWTVTRAVDGSTAVSHASNWTCQQIISEGSLNGFQQNAELGSSSVLSTTTTAASTLFSYTPAPQDQPAAGVTYEFAAYGTMGTTTTTTGTVITFTLAWNGVTIAQLVTGTGTAAMTTGLTTAGWMIKGYVNCLSSTSMVAGFMLVTHKGTTSELPWVTATGDGSAAMAGVAITGTGPLTLTVAYTTSQASNVLHGVGVVERIQ